MIARLYVDAPRASSAEAPAPLPQDDPAGFPSPSIGQCEEISRHLALALDVEDCIEGAYTLEVSTPGFSRVFFNLSQMRPYLGEMLEIRLRASIAPTPLAGQGRGADLSPRRLWRGKLAGIADDAFILEPAFVSADGGIFPEPFRSVRISWDDVHRANRLHIFQRPAKPGKKTK
jgi:ribosome maturation factor RimP